jgi:uncharacterized protein YjbJ (UPF0337 family)
MDWHQLEGNWDKLKGKVKGKWAKFTDEDIAIVKGRKDDLVGRIKHVYGSAHEDAVRQSDEFMKSLKRDAASDNH